MARSDSVRSLPSALAAAVPGVVTGPASGVEVDGAVEWSSATPPSATATPNTARNSAISVLRLRFRGSCGVTLWIFPVTRSGHAGHDQARCPGRTGLADAFDVAADRIGAPARPLGASPRVSRAAVLSPLSVIIRRLSTTN